MCTVSSGTVMGKYAIRFTVRLELFLGELSSLSFRESGFGGGLSSSSPATDISITRGSSVPRRIRSLPSRIRVTFAQTIVPPYPRDVPPTTRVRTIRKVTYEFIVACSNSDGSTGVNSSGISRGSSDSPISASCARAQNELLYTKNVGAGVPPPSASWARLAGCAASITNITTHSTFSRDFASITSPRNRYGVIVRKKRRDQENDEDSIASVTILTNAVDRRFRRPYGA